MLTAKQHILLHLIKDYTDKNDGVSPSYEEMMQALGLKSKSGVHRLIKALEERGYLRRLPHRARALEVLTLPGNGTTSGGDSAPLPRPQSPSTRASTPFNGGNGGNGVIELPLYGRIAAGTPIEAIQNAGEYIEIPASMLRGGEHYALEVSGDSMIEAGIHDGDTAIIRKCDTAENGAIVVALVDNEEATLKYIHRTQGHIALVPANESYETRHCLSEQIKIQGRLAGILRRY